jgi:hypothetical protein
MANHYCRVCGLYHEQPPWGEDERTPLFIYCACCGVEFGHQDCLPIAARRFRERWLNAGALWDNPRRKPPDWNLEVQLRSIPDAFR